jgi:hypothetical protein
LKDFNLTIDIELSQFRLITQLLERRRHFAPAELQRRR